MTRVATAEQYRLENFPAFLDAHRAGVFALAGALIAAIALLDWIVFPMSRWGRSTSFPFTNKTGAIYSA
jgi:hypothetical protein